MTRWKTKSVSIKTMIKSLMIQCLTSFWGNYGRTQRQPTSVNSWLKVRTFRKRLTWRKLLAKWTPRTTVKWDMSKLGEVCSRLVASQAALNSSVLLYKTSRESAVKVWTSYQASWRQSKQRSSPQTHTASTASTTIWTRRLSLLTPTWLSHSASKPTLWLKTCSQSSCAGKLPQRPRRFPRSKATWSTQSTSSVTS